MSVFKMNRKVMKDGQVIQVPSDSYYGKYKNENGAWVRVRLFSNKEASKHELNRLSEIALKIRTGQISPTISKGQETPLKDHVDDYCAFVRGKSKKGDPQWSNEQKAKLVMVFKQAKACWVKDITKDKIESALDSLARIHGWSKQTSNHYLRAVKAFFSWMLSKERIGFNPVDCLKPNKVHDSDMKRPRRAFTAAECQYLITFLAYSKDGRKVINPPRVRALLYALAFQSGLRAKELFSLKPLNFNFENGTVTILGKHSKNASTGVIPLPQPLVQQIKEHTTGMDKSKPIFKGTYFTSLAGKRLKKDMAKARESYIQESRTPKEKEARINDDFLLYKNDMGETLDFHSLRSGYVSALVECGANIKAVQMLARHQDAKTTMKHYAKIKNQQELAKVVATMPSLLVSLGDQKQDQGDQKRDQIIDIQGCQTIFNDNQSEELTLTQVNDRYEVTPCLPEEEYMRPVRFEPTTLGLGNWDIKTINTLIKKLVPNATANTGDQKQDQTFLDGKLLELNFSWRELPVEARALIVAVFMASNPAGKGLKAA